MSRRAWEREVRFAWSLEELLAFSHDPRAAVLASNTEYLGAGATAFGAVDYAEREVGCVRVGFFGMVSMPWNELNEQYDGPYYPELDTRYDYVARAEDLVAAHRADVDLLVMVSHLGLAMDQNVAADVDGIDVVLGGHSHDALDSPGLIGDTLVIHPGAYGSHAAVLDMEVDSDTGDRLGHHYELVPNEPGTLPVAGGMQAAVETVMATHAPDALVELAWLAGNLYDSQIAQLTAHAAMQELTVDAVLVDRDTVWLSWLAGPLTQQDLADTYKVERQPAGTPGFNSFYLADILGADLRAIQIPGPPPALGRGDQQPP